MKANSFLLFDVLVEKEKRFTVSPEVIHKALNDRAIQISDVIEINQTWIMNGNKYAGRIRCTKKMFKNAGEVSYEHTVKHHINKNMDYEVTTELTEHDYEVLKKLYKDINPQIKTRLYITDTANAYRDYIITVDYPKDKSNECWVEFELKESSENNKGFVKPEWLEEEN